MISKHVGEKKNIHLNFFRISHFFLNLLTMGQKVCESLPSVHQEATFLLHRQSLPLGGNPSLIVHMPPFVLIFHLARPPARHDSQQEDPFASSFGSFSFSIAYLCPFLDLRSFQMSKHFRRLQLPFVASQREMLSCFVLRLFDSISSLVSLLVRQ